MKAKNFAATAAVMVLASAAFAGEEVHTRMKIVVVDGSDEAETRIVLDSEELGFNLHDMQVGENQSFIDASGRNILITRENDGFLFNADGKTIKLPPLDGDHDAHDGHKVKIIKKKIEIKSESPEA